MKRIMPFLESARNDISCIVHHFCHFERSRKADLDNLTPRLTLIMIHYENSIPCEDTGSAK